MTVAHVLINALIGFRAKRGGKHRHKGEDNGKGTAERQFALRHGLSLRHGRHQL